jgi:hypothetical protein
MKILKKIDSAETIRSAERADDDQYTVDSGIGKLVQGTSFSHRSTETQLATLSTLTTFATCA